MNPPQYLPPQQYGGPPNFQNNRSSPSLGSNPGQFQNVPLGPPPKSNPMGPGAGQFPPSSVGGPMSRNPIPTSQLPPMMNMPPPTNPFSIPPTLKNDPPHSNNQNGPNLSQNGPSQFYNGPSGQLPPSSQQNKPSPFGPPPPSIQSVNTTLSSSGSPKSVQPPISSAPPASTFAAPSSSFPNDSAYGVGDNPQTSMLGQFSTVPGGLPPVSSSGSGQQLSSISGPPLSNISGPPPPSSGLSGPPPPSSISGPPPPNSISGPLPTTISGPLSSGNMTGPPPPNSISGAPPMSTSSSLPTGLSTNLTGGHQIPQSFPGAPPSLHTGSKPNLPPTSNVGNFLSGPPLSGPQIPVSQMSGHPFPGPPSSNLPGGPVPSSAQPSKSIPASFPSMNQFPGQPGQLPMAGNQPPVTQYGQFPSGPPPPMGPPRPGGVQSPLNNQNYGTQPGIPPLPGQGPPSNFNQPNPFGQQPSGMPPPLNPGQLANQMQGMNLSGPRQYPGVPGPMKNTMNGDMGPHMPPPINQQQQMRPPGGYPPMPGLGPLPGQGPMSGQGPMPGGGMPGQIPSGPGAYPQPNYQQPQQQRRLDPDQMPNPIQVTQDDQQNRSGIFVTNQKGLVPPLVTTNFIAQDQGNASPRYIRSTMYNVPISQDIIKQTAVPFSLVISPMARQMDQEYPPPIVNFGELGPVRCIRCKAYMCPYMQFIDSGRRFQCLFCKATTDVPTEYFQHLDHTGQRMDRFERPELILGTYEFVATADYCRNNTLPKPPAIIFVIDVSYNNVKSGLVHLLCSQMKEIIQNLPADQGQEKSNMRVGFITYNSSVHFYNIKGNLAAPQMLVVGDVQEMFMPLLDGFLCTPEESGLVIDALMQQIPAMFGDTKETETVLLPAIQAGLEALKASECTGKLLVFHSSLPAAEAPGKLKNREDRKLLGTDKEKTILTPQNQAYNQLGQDCVGVGCSVDLFVFNNSYIDIATIGQVARLTGGEVFKYTYFQADLDGDRLINDIIMDISRPIAFDAIMRVRTSTGVRPTDFYGHFYMSNTTDMELASIDCDKAVAIEIKHDDKLAEEEGVYIQAALLYTSCGGQRRLRIINLSLKTCSQMADLYRSCELDTLINYFSKQAVYRLLDNNPKAVKESIVSRAAQILATYRKNCASPSSAGQLILPECMKLLPLYVNCLLKSDALSGGSDMTIDDRSFVMMSVMTMDISSSVYHFYPRLIPIHEIDTSKDPVPVPAPVRCSIEKMNDQGVYILENGIHMFLWFGLNVNPEFIQKLFGASSALQVDIDRIGLPELDNPVSLAVRSIIDEIRIQRHRCMRLTIVRQREKLEAVFKHFLVEDRGTDGSPSYVDFLCHMHKEIRALLS